MLKILYRGSLLSQLKNNSNSLKRFFLSNAFKCTEAWENRLKAPVFQEIQLGNLYAALEKNFSVGRIISVIDVDIFVNGAADEMYQSEVEDVLHKLRLCPETTVMYESTSHAAIRSFISWNKKKDLLNILSQRLLYGLYPDVYLSILMMDSFLTENDFISAMKIAVLQMLQEDCNYPILRGLSLYSCIKYLNSSDIWPTPKEEIDEDEEVVKIRVDYIRNEYYDDHFDIIDTNHLIGKTMFSFGKTVEGPIGNSCQLIGLILYEKFDQVKTFVLDLLKEDLPIHKEAVEKAKSYLQNKPKQEIEQTDKKEDDSNNANVTLEEKPIINELAKLLDELSKKNLLTDSLEVALEQYVKEEVKDHENNYIMKQCEIYKKWEEKRLKDFEEQVNEEKKRLVRNEIDEIRQQLEAEEKKLFYHENEVEYDEIIKAKKYEMENIQYYESKNKYVQSPQQGYLPPERRRRLFSKDKSK